MRMTIPAMAAALAACTLSPSTLPAQDALLGAFGLTALDGDRLPAASPDVPGLTIASVTLRLSAERFELASTFSTEGDSVQAAPVITGPWERTEDELLFFPEQSGPEEIVRFRYAWQGSQLILTDPNGHRWTLERLEG